MDRKWTKIWASTVRELSPELDFPESADESQFFVRMFKHEFGGGSKLRRPGPLADAALILSASRWGISGDDDLAADLIQDLLVTLVENDSKPRYLFLVHEAVRMATRSSKALDHLQKLESLGVKILLNKHSLHHYGVEREIRVGEAVTMMEMVGTFMSVEKVISLP